VLSEPEGPTISSVTNTTKTAAPPTLFNGTGNGSAGTTSGGYIYVINLNSNQQNFKWKAFVGNVTGKLVLAGADNYAIYDWDITSTMRGEVYATRASETINWANINCSTLAQIENENIALNHTSPSDNISATFSTKDNSKFEIGTTIIPQNTCYTTNLYVDGAPPADDAFEEIVLSDGTNIVYATKVSDNHDAYKNSNETYDFQMIVPEIGLTTWTGSTPYYLYVELE